MIVLLLFILMAACDSLPASPYISNPIDSPDVSKYVSDDYSNQNALLKKISNQNGVAVLAFFEADYDGDGRSEAFAYVSNGQILGWQIWFVSEEDAECVYESPCAANVSLLEQENRRFFVAEWQVSAGTSVATVSGVVDQKPFTVSMPMNFKWDDLSNSFSGEDSILDGGIDDGDRTVGRTWKPYWFYWNTETNSFDEYIASELTIAEFSTYPSGSKIVADLEKESYEVVNILRRENQVVNINFQRSYLDRTDLYCLTLYYSEDWKSLKSIIYSRGKYKNSILDK